MDNDVTGFDSNEQEVGFCIIPPYILGRNDLSLGHKVLYGRIVGLTKLKGYCYASNAWLGNVLNVTANRISHLLGELKQKKLIDIEVLRNDKKEIIERKIYTLGSRVDEQDLLLNSTRPIVKNNKTPIVKNNKESSTVFKKTDEVIEEKDSLRNYIELFPTEYSQDRRFRHAWLGWVQHRKEKKNPITKTTAERQRDKILKLNLADAIDMIEFSTECGYTGLFQRNKQNGFSFRKPDNYLAPSDPDKYDNIQEKQALRRKRLAEEEQRRNGQNVFGTLPA